MARHDVGRGAANLHPATPPGPGVSGHALSRVKLRSTYILQRRTSQMSAVSAWRAVGLWICSTYLLQRRMGRTSVESTSRGGGQGAAAHLHPVTPSRPGFSGFHATRMGGELHFTYCLRRRMFQTSVGSARRGPDIWIHLQASTPNRLDVSGIPKTIGGGRALNSTYKLQCRRSQASAKSTWRGVAVVCSTYKLQRPMGQTSVVFAR